MNKTRILDAYIECALWASFDENDDQPLEDNYSPSDLAPECLDQMRADVHAFVDANADLLDDMPEDLIGHDFWLTRNRHGAGFWDRGLGERGEALTKASHAYGEVYLYVGDDGKLYC